MEAFTGTRPLAQPLDTVALEAWLAAHVPGFAGPLNLEQFKGGQSNPTYLLKTPGAQYVMRSKPGPVAKLLPSAHAIEREFAVMGALAGSAVPVPAMLALCEDEGVIGRAFYVMSFMAGRVLWDQSLPGMANADRAAHYEELNRVMKTDILPDYFENPYSFTHDWTQADVSQSKAALGYVPAFDLRNGIEAYEASGKLGVAVGV